MDRPRVLIVDDEPMVVDVLTRYLLRDDFAVEVARDGPSALAAAHRLTPDLVILDVMLPHLDGMEVCRALRKRSAVPIMMLTARGQETDKIHGLGLGADDYVVKPFGPNEVVARVKALLRRAAMGSKVSAEAEVQLPGLAIRPALRQVERNGQVVALTATEFDLLLHLARHPRQVFTREQLLDAVWDHEFGGDPSTVTVHVRRLRAKLELDPSHPRLLQTAWGVGYRLEPGPS